MRLLAFDGRMGASGDMLLGALLAAGADSAVLETVEDELDVRYDTSQVTRCGISATHVAVRLDGDHGNAEGYGHNHDNVDGGDHNHDHDEGHDNGHGHAEGAGPHRTYPEVVDLVVSMDLPSDVERTALAIFERLGEAEASVHGTDLESTHFHEVGADDAIADVVGVALLLADLDVDRVVTTPLSTGGGTVEMSHGIYPVPPPAVVELAEMADWSLRGGPVETELLTPTGAAVLAEIAEGVERLPTLGIDQSGYGAGSKSFDSLPNVLRALVGQSEAALRQESITVLETHLDDTTPEVLGGLSETLADVGALDVTIVPATMKKSRPGHLVKIVTHPENAGRVARELARETGTLGVREHGSGHRFVADRSVESVTVEVDGEEFSVDVKVARLSGEDGEVFDLSCEYDDAREVAEKTGEPTRAIMRRAEQVAEELFD